MFKKTALFWNEGFPYLNTSLSSILLIRDLKSRLTVINCCVTQSIIDGVTKWEIGPGWKKTMQRMQVKVTWRSINGIKDMLTLRLNNISNYNWMYFTFLFSVHVVKWFLVSTFIWALCRHQLRCLQLLEMNFKQTIEMGRECEDPSDNEQASVSGDRLSFHPKDAKHKPIFHWATLKQRLLHQGKELKP